MNAGRIEQISTPEDLYLRPADRVEYGDVVRIALDPAPVAVRPLP